jgi:hypothetical protein
MSEPELEAALLPTDPKPARAPARDLPDFADVHKELQDSNHSNGGVSHAIESSRILTEHHWR